MFDAVGAGDGPHLNAVGDDQAVVAQFAAEEFDEDPPGEGARVIQVQGRGEDVGAHHRPGAGLDRRAERHQVAFGQHGGVGVDARHRVVGVDGGVAVAGEVLGAGGHTRRLQAGDVGGGVPGDQGGVGAEGPYADHRVVGVGVDVGGRGPVEVHAAGGEAAAQFGGDAPGQLHVVDRAERVVAGEGGAGAHLQTGDVAALLVDGDQHVVAFGAQLGGERGDLLGGGDVAAEQGDGREALAEPAQQPVGGGGAGEAGLEDGQRVASRCRCPGSVSK
ncbi:hypothetical protein SFUMM280S_07720 [Streptomyces fumanus]